MMHLPELLGSLPDMSTAYVEIRGPHQQPVLALTLSRHEGTLHASRLFSHELEGIPPCYTSYLQDMHEACARTPWVTSLEQDLQWGWGAGMEDESLDVVESTLGCNVTHAPAPPVDVDARFDMEYKVLRVHPGVVDNGCPRIRVCCKKPAIGNP
jgi:hypothetical protein